MDEDLINQNIEKEWVLVPVVVARIVIYSVVILITVAGNLFIVITSVVDRQMRTTSNAFFASMAMADLLQGTTNNLFAAVQGIHRDPSEMGKALCILWCILEGSCGTVSLYHLLAIATHRLRSIVSPFRSQRKTNLKTRNIITLSLIWTLPFGLWSVHYALKNLGPEICAEQNIKAFVIFNVIVLYFIPFVGIVAVNVCIGVALRKMKNLCDVHGGMNEQELHRHEKQRRGIVTLTICNTVFLICWTPHVVLWMLYNVFQGDVSVIVKYVIYLLYYIHPMLQPILLISLNNNFTNKFKHLLKGHHQVDPLSLSFQTVTTT